MKDIHFWHKETSAGKTIASSSDPVPIISLYPLTWSSKIGGDKTRKSLKKQLFLFYCQDPWTLNLKTSHLIKCNRIGQIQAWFLDEFPGILKSLILFGKQLPQFLQLMGKKIPNIYYKSQEAFTLKHGVATLSIKLNFLSRSLTIET